MNMYLTDLISKIESNLCFTLYDADNDRIGTFTRDDVGYEQWVSRDIRYIDVIDDKLCIFLDCLQGGKL